MQRYASVALAVALCLSQVRFSKKMAEQTDLIFAVDASFDLSYPLDWTLKIFKLRLDDESETWFKKFCILIRFQAKV